MSEGLSLENANEYVDSANYISPPEAIDLICHYAGNVVQAKQVIADGLRAGKVDAIADFLWESQEDYIEEVWVPKRNKGLMFEQDVLLERGFWMISQGWPDDLAQWRWESGDFVLYGAPREFDFAIMYYLTGVALKRTDVLALVGRSSRVGIGGRKPDRAKWADFWTDVLFGAASPSFDWTQFDNKHQLRMQLLEWTGDTFSENNIDVAVDAVWEKVVTRCAADNRIKGRSRVTDP